MHILFYMNFDYINQITENLNVINVSILDSLIRFVVSAILGILSSFIYKLYSKGNYIQDLQQSLIFLSLIICSSMMIIGNNLASAFGLVGAVSIIRFRTSVKSSRDMAFVLFNITIGMACGLGFIYLSILSFILIGSIMLIVFKVSNNGNHIGLNQYKLEISYLGSLIESKLFETILDKYKSQYNLSSISSNQDKIKYIYNLALVDPTNITNIVDDLNKIETLNAFKIKCTLVEGNYE